MTGLEPATSGVTGRRSNQLSYTRVRRLAEARCVVYEQSAVRSSGFQHALQTDCRSNAVYPCRTEKCRRAQPSVTRNVATIKAWRSSALITKGGMR